VFGSSYKIRLVYQKLMVAMCVQILKCLKSKYLLFFSARWVSRHAGIDVTSFCLISACLEVSMNSKKSWFCVIPSADDAAICQLHSACLSSSRVTLSFYPVCFFRISSAEALLCPCLLPVFCSLTG